MVVAHRLKGAAALHGYPVVSAVALVLEEMIEELPAAPDGERPRRLEVLAEVVATVKRMLETIGDDGREDVDAVVRLRARHPGLFSPGRISSRPRLPPSPSLHPTASPSQGSPGGSILPPRRRRHPARRSQCRHLKPAGGHRARAARRP